jgi:hypothetical protein
MNNQSSQQTSQEFLDPDNRETLLKFLRGRNANINEGMIDIVNMMSPLRVMEKVMQDNSVGPAAQSFFKKIEATNNGAKPGENFEDFLWRYIESDDVPSIAEDELDGLALVYEKISGTGPQQETNDNEDEPDVMEQEKPKQTDSGIKLQVKPHPSDVPQNDLPDESATNQREVKVEPAPKAPEKAKGNLKEAIKASQIDLVKEMEIDKLPKEEQEKVLLELGDIIQQRILLRVVEEFPEDKKEQLLKLTESKDASPEQFNEFVEKNLPNIEEIVSDEVEKYKKEMLDFTKEVLGE